MNNPYVTSPWVKEHNFYGRTNLLEKFSSDNRGLIWLIGNRKVGKTSLLRKLEEISGLKGEMVPIYIDISGISKFSDLSNRLWRAVTFGNSKRFFKELSIDLADCKNLDFFSFQYEILERLEKVDRRVFLLFDEVEGLLKILENDPSGSELSNINRMAGEWCNLSEQVYVVIASSTRLKALSKYDSLTTSLLAQFSERYYIGPLFEAEAIDLIRQVHNPEGSVNVDDEILLEILEMTGCQPLFIQLLCQQLYQYKANTLKSIGDLDRQANDTIRSVFEEDTKALNGFEKQILLHLTSLDLNDKCTKSKHELSTELKIPAPIINEMIQNFVYLGMIKEQPKGRYQIASEYLYSWLIAHQKEVEAEIVKENEVKEPKVISISVKKDDTGYSFQRLFGPYVRGAKIVHLCDPYIRDEVQIKNLLSFANILDTSKGLVELKLTTNYNPHIAAESEKSLTSIYEKIAKNLLENGINFHFEFDPDKHDRWIKTDTGWKITLGRGLDIFQRQESRFGLSDIDQAKRKCLETEIVYRKEV